MKPPQSLSIGKQNGSAAVRRFNGHSADAPKSAGVIPAPGRVQNGHPFPGPGRNRYGRRVILIFQVIEKFQFASQIVPNFLRHRGKPQKAQSPLAAEGIDRIG